MAKAKKLASGRWRVLAYVGKEITKSGYKSFTADTKKEAEYLAAEYVLNAKRKAKIADITLGEAMDKYTESKSNILSPRTIREYRRLRKAEFQDIINKRLCDITQEDIQREVNQAALAKSAKTVNNAHCFLSAVFSMYAPGFHLRTSLPKRKPVDLYTPNDEDIRCLLSGLSSDEDLLIAVLLAAFGPMRRGEICALDSSDISGNTVRICKNMVLGLDNSWVIKAPKSQAGYRIIDLPSPVIERIQGRVGRIVPLTPNQITDRFYNAVRKYCKYPFRFHDLRHYSASMLHALGIPDKYIMARGGWSTPAVLQNVYQHTLSDQAQTFSDAANNHFSKIIQHEIQHDSNQT